MHTKYFAEASDFDEDAPFIPLDSEAEVKEHFKNYTNHENSD